MSLFNGKLFHFLFFSLIALASSLKCYNEFCIEGSINVDCERKEKECNFDLAKQELDDILSDDELDLSKVPSELKWIASKFPPEKLKPFFQAQRKHMDWIHNPIAFCSSGEDSKSNFTVKVKVCNFYSKELKPTIGCNKNGTLTTCSCETDLCNTGRTSKSSLFCGILSMAISLFLFKSIWPTF